MEDVVVLSAAQVSGLLRVSPFTMHGPRDEKFSTGLVLFQGDSKPGGEGQGQDARYQEVRLGSRAGALANTPSRPSYTW